MLDTKYILMEQISRSQLVNFVNMKHFFLIFLTPQQLFQSFQLEKDLKIMLKENFRKQSLQNQYFFFPQSLSHLIFKNIKPYMLYNKNQKIMIANINKSQSRISDLIDTTNQQIKENSFQDPNNQQNEKNNKKRRKICIIICAATFAIILGTTLGLLLNRSKPQPNPQPAPYIYSCLDFPTECQGVQQNVRAFIFQSSSNPDQIRAQLQIGRSFSGIQTNTRVNLTEVYKSVVRSVQCLAYIMPNTFSQAYFNMVQLQFQTEQSLIDYLNMTYSFSGQALILTPTTEVASTCQFNLTSTTSTRVRNLQSGCGASATQVLLYFDGNGFSPISSFRNLKTITKLFEQNSSVSFDGGAIYVGSYRVDGTTDFFSNLLTGFEQSLQQNSQSVPSRLSLLHCLRIITDGAPVNTGLPSDVTQEVMDLLYRQLSIQTIFSMNNIQTNYNTDWHKQFVGKQIKAGKKVVLVSHGQGAIYSNKIYDLLSAGQQSSVGLVYTAPYANSMADGLTNYLSNPADVVLTSITAVATATNLISVPLSPNMQSTTFNSSFDSGYNHDFQAYVQSYISQFSQLIISAKNRITQPTTILGKGPITIQLLWDSQPDVDMHVFEPNNVHVSWLNKDGVVGTLQLDATDGYGPQYYYTRCQSMLPGEYIAAVNYYYGYSPSTVRMTVQAGTEYFVRTMVLPTAMGSDGDQNPIQVCKIVATLVNPNTGYYTFQITEL